MGSVEGSEYTAHFIGADGQVERSPTVRYGFTLSLPITEIPPVRKWADHRLRKKRRKFPDNFEIPEEPADC